MNSNETITISEARAMIRNHMLVIKDTSGPRSYGYEFSVFRTEQVDGPIPYERATGDALAVSTTRYEADTRNKLGNMGAYRTVFNRADIEALIN